MADEAPRQVLEQVLHGLLAVGGGH
jgi:hypothetical protein